MCGIMKFITFGVSLTLVSANLRNITPDTIFPSEGGTIVNSVIQENLLKILLKSPDVFKVIGAGYQSNAKAENGNVEKQFKIPRSILKTLAGFAIPTTSSDNRISQQCREDSWFYAEALMKLDEWALKMLDASGKLPSGIANANVYSMGHFDQCLQIRAPEINSAPKFTAKYCTLFLEPKIVSQNEIKQKYDNPVSDILGSLNLVNEFTEPVYVNKTDFLVTGLLPSIGLCLPSSCSAQDIGIAVASNIGQYVFNEKHVSVFTNEDFCTVGGAVREYDTLTTSAIYFFGLLGFLLALGTAYDVLLHRKSEPQKESNKCRGFLLSFSVLENVSKILDTKVSAKSTLTCLHGIRFLSMVWVILAHVWMLPFFLPNANRPQAKQEGLAWPYQILMNAALAVDTFFFLSGLLVAYAGLREMDKTRGKFNLSAVYINRYLRLTPVYAAILLFIATLYGHVASGPTWGNVLAYTKGCRREWWKHFLYINNLFSEDVTASACMRETWYLAADMQMFMVAPIFVYLLWHWPKRGLAVLAGAVTFFTAISMIAVAVNDLPLHFITVRSDHLLIFVKYFTKYYQLPWCRIQTYLVGMFMGFVLYKTQSYKIRMSPWLSTLSWSVASAIGLAVLFGLYGYTDETKAPVIPTSVSVFYAGLHRIVWTISLGWLVFACVHGYGGLVNRILSWPAFIPLSRLTYCTYLVHLNWLSLHYSYVRTVFYYSQIETVLYFFATLTMSMSLAFVVSVCVELPSQNLVTLFSKRRDATNKDENVIRIIENDFNKVTTHNE